MGGRRPGDRGRRGEPVPARRGGAVMRSVVRKAGWTIVAGALACSSVAGGNGGTGVLRGAVSIGPICPVEQEGVPCPVPPETYAGVQVLVQSAATGRVLERVPLDDTGHYEVA